MQKGVRFYDSSHRKNARLSMPSIRQRSAIAGMSLDLAHHDLGDGLRGEGTPDEVVKKHGFQVVSDDGALEKAVDEALAASPDIVEKLKSGNMVVCSFAVVSAYSDMIIVSYVSRRGPSPHPYRRYCTRLNASWEFC